MRFYTTEKLGPKRELTPEGYLVCYDVPLARTGTQLYGAGEIPLVAGGDGLIRVDREAEHVFHANAISSAQGKPVVDEHPFQGDPTRDGWDVTPDNWRDLSRGVVINPRRGEGIMDDILVGDVMITDAGAIEAVLNGKIELSCGYAADYEQIAPGHGRQHNIVINHLALVEHGRCGTRCSIGDEDTMTNTRDHAPKNITLARAFATLDGLVAAFKGKTLDEKTIQAATTAIRDDMTQMGKVDLAEEGQLIKEGSAQHIHVHLPGSGATESADATEADPAVTGEEVPADMAAVSARLDRLEAALTKVIATLSGGAEEEVVAEEPEDGEAAIVGDAELLQTGEEDPVPAATGDEEILKTGEEDPVPAATGDKQIAVRVRDGKMFVVKGAAQAGDKTVTVRVRDGKMFLVRGPKTKTRDSVHLKDNFTDVVARAEFLAPGMKAPTYDAKLDATKTVSAICGFRRQVLAKAWSTQDGRAAITPIYSGDLPKAIKAMTCDQVKTLFNGSAELAKVANNARLAAEGGRTRDQDTGVKKLPTLRDINERNRKQFSQPTHG